MGSHTNISLKMVNGVPSVAWALDDKRKRPPVLDECEDRNSRFELLPNVDSPEALLRAFEVFEFAPIHSIFASTVDLPSQTARITGIPRPEAILEAMGIRPTRTKLERTKETLQTWKSDCDAFRIIPIYDCMALIGDLKALVSALMYGAGACTPLSLAMNVGKGFAFLDKGTSSQECYGGFLSQVSDGEPGILELWERYLPLLQKAGNDSAPKEIGREALFDLSAASINLFMGLAHPCIRGRQFYMDGGSDSFSEAYVFWAENVLAGKAGACERCGKLFLRRRSTKKYCSSTCSQRSYEIRNDRASSA